MKIHIVQRNDTFQSIAEKYNVSVQDLIGMNTHINHLAGLVPGLKVKVPSPVRKDESNVAQHIQKYYPNLDTNPVELKTITTVAILDRCQQTSFCIYVQVHPSNASPTSSVPANKKPC